MAEETFEQYSMHKDMHAFDIHAFVEQSVAQARTAFDGILQSATTALRRWQGHAQTAHSSATDIANKSIAFAHQNMAATFDFAEKLMNARDPAEVMRLQSEFLNSQIKTISVQIQELGQTGSKMVGDIAKQKP